MTTRPFGHPRPVLPPTRRQPVDPHLVAEVAAELLPKLNGDGLVVKLVDSDNGPAVDIIEDERHLRETVCALAREMEHAQVPATRDGIAEALAAWIDHRPVTDRQARTFGVAVLDWTDSTCTQVGWRVVVPRSHNRLLPWTPSPDTDDRTVHQIRSAALGRAATVPVRMRIEGQVALYTATPVELSTAVLVDPWRMLAEMAYHGLGGPTTHMIITPGRPVAAAEQHVAERLVAEASEPHQYLRWNMISDLRWV